MFCYTMVLNWRLVVCFISTNSAHKFVGFQQIKIENARIFIEAQYKALYIDSDMNIRLPFKPYIYVKYETFGLSLLFSFFCLIKKINLLVYLQKNRYTKGLYGEICMIKKNGAVKCEKQKHIDMY